MRKVTCIMKSAKGSISIEAALVFPILLLIVCLFVIQVRVSLTTANLKHIALTNADFFATSPESVADLVLLRLNAKKQWNTGDGNLKLVGPIRTQGDVCVTAKTKVKGAVPFMNMKSVELVQKGFSLDWTSNLKGESKVPEKNVWDLAPIQRGVEIQKHFGRNLPKFFPTICIFELGKVVSIISIDVTAKTYLNPGGIEKEIAEGGAELASFTGGENTGVSVSSSQILVKELWIVIPSGSLTATQDNELSNAIKSVQNQGIIIKVIEYQSKGVTLN